MMDCKPEARSYLPNQEVCNDDNPWQVQRGRTRPVSMAELQSDTYRRNEVSRAAPRDVVSHIVWLAENSNYAKNHLLWTIAVTISGFQNMISMERNSVTENVIQVFLEFWEQLADDYKSFISYQINLESVDTSTTSGTFVCVLFLKCMCLRIYVCACLQPVLVQQICGCSTF